MRYAGGHDISQFSYRNKKEIEKSDEEYQLVKDTLSSLYNETSYTDEYEHPLKFNDIVKYLDDERQIDVLRMRFIVGMTLKQVGDRLSVNPERVRQIEAKALRKLRHPDNSRHIKQCLPSYQF